MGEEEVCVKWGVSGPAAAVMSVGRRRSFEGWDLGPVGHLLSATFGILSM